MGFQDNKELASENGKKSKRGMGKATKKLKDFFQAILDENQEQIREDLQSLEPKDRILIQMKMAEFVEPKLRAVENKPDIDGMSDKQVDAIIERVLQASSREQKIINLGMGSHE